MELEKLTGAPIFLDSDDLQDLRLLLDHVRASDVLVLLQAMLRQLHSHLHLTLVTTFDLPRHLEPRSGGA